jgi:hypothetical protein
MEEKKISFWKRQEVWGTVALIGLAGVQFPSHTTAFKVGTFANGAVGVAITWFGIKKGYQSDNLKNLPTGLRTIGKVADRVMDKLPNTLTGEKEQYL